MIHHIGVFASDFEASRDFYRAALLPLGIIVGYETDDVAEFWRLEDDTPSISLERANGEVTKGLHVAFASPDRSSVEAFFEAALSAGGRERHPPRFWPEYAAFCAFVSDPDGNNVEAVHK
jgi:catechol 2,3-dioxygenase-like lactoylglutathione lyase family enzyme